MLGKSPRIHHYRATDVFTASLFFIACLCLLLFAQPVSAAIVDTGEVFGWDIPDKTPLPVTSWNSEDTWGFVGRESEGSLEINSGSDVDTLNCYIGVNEDVSGTVTVDGSGSTLDSVGFLSIGTQGQAVLNITGGADVYSHEVVAAEWAERDEDNDDEFIYKSSAAITVDGAGSTWTVDNAAIIGGMGDATMSVLNGAQVTFGQQLDIAGDGGSESSITVDGVGSAMTVTAQFFIGTGGDGSLNITNGGYVETNNSLYVCRLGDGTITIDGDGSKLKAKTTTYIWGKGDDVGKIIVQNEGRFQSEDHIVVGSDVDKDGEGGTNYLIVDGSGSVASTTGYVHAGYRGDGAVRIVNGGGIACTRAIMGTQDVNPGIFGAFTVDGEGSKLYATHDVTVGETSPGVLTITNGGYVRVTTRDLLIGVDGSYIQMATGGILAYHDDGTCAASIAAFLNGAVQGNDDIRYWNDSTLSWDSITSATAGVDYTLAFEDGYTLLTVGTVPVVADPHIGDADRDGDVDDRDFAALSKYWMTKYTATWEMGDFNDDGCVNGEDVALLSVNWGWTGGYTVPEPSTLVGLLSLCLAGLLALARRRG